MEIEYRHLLLNERRNIMKCSKNVGSVDRMIRLIVGAILVGLAATGTVGVWGWIGLILIGTAFFSFCPLYRIVGMKTCPKE